jgi:hypothetical protein
MKPTVQLIHQTNKSRMFGDTVQVIARFLDADGNMMPHDIEEIMLFHWLDKGGKWKGTGGYYRPTEFAVEMQMNGVNNSYSFAFNNVNKIEVIHKYFADNGYKVVREIRVY